MGNYKYLGKKCITSNGKVKYLIVYNLSLRNCTWDFNEKAFQSDFDVLFDEWVENMQKNDPDVFDGISIENAYITSKDLNKIQYEERILIEPKAVHVLEETITGLKKENILSSGSYEKAREEYTHLNPKDSKLCVHIH